MFNKPTIDGAISHFTKGVTQLRLVEENANATASEKMMKSEELASESLDANEEALHAKRIADRLDELLS
jgi:hypothetical protein